MMGCKYVNNSGAGSDVLLEDGKVLYMARKVSARHEMSSREMNIIERRVTSQLWSIFNKNTSDY